ncbi:MAG: hypothetical protein ACOX2A_05020 [Tepidanaerobacteraceae bacterium]|jgi:hypothetical protein
MFNYDGLQKILIRSFKCGFCGDKVSSDRGYRVGKLKDGYGEKSEEYIFVQTV